MNQSGNPTAPELDEITDRLLACLAETWGVSKEEALRRALEQADTVTGALNRESRLKKFKALQRSLSLTPAKAAEWQDAIREARR